VSILLAFAIDAAWGQRLEDQRLSAALLGLDAEFRTNLASLREVQATHQRAFEAAGRILGMTGPGAEVPEDIASFERDLYEVVGWWMFYPESGQLSSLLNSGDLSIVSDDDLRVALAAWPDRVRKLNSVEEIQQLLSETLLIPFVQNRVPLRHAIAARRPELLSSGSFAPRYTALLSDLEFEGFMANRVWSLEAILTEISAVRVALEDILRRIAEYE